MRKSSMKKAVGFSLLVAAAIAFLVVISAPAHTTHAAAVQSNHMIATNGLSLPSSNHASLTPTPMYPSLKVGICPRCIMAHPYEASLVGA